MCMCKNFYSDLAKAKGAEDLVRETFQKLKPEWAFEDVSDERHYFHKGDIKAISPEGKEVMIEVKDDSRIADTRNILCEERVYYWTDNTEKPGNFYSDYEIYCVVSKSEGKIYVLDFSVMKKIYKNYQSRLLRHYDQSSLVYLVPLSCAKKHGAIIAEVDYQDLAVAA